MEPCPERGMHFCVNCQRAGVLYGTKCVCAQQRGEEVPAGSSEAQDNPPPPPPLPAEAQAETSTATSSQGNVASQVVEPIAMDERPGETYHRATNVAKSRAPPSAQLNTL